MDTVDLEQLHDSRERAGAPVLWLSCEGQIDIWEMFSDNTYLSAIHDRQGLQVAAPIDLGTKKALATNWIKDRPDGLKLQNLALATRTGRSIGSLPKNLIASVHCAINKCESLGSGKHLTLHGNPSAIARDFSPHVAVLRRHFFAECALAVLCVTLGHPRSRL